MGTQEVKKTNCQFCSAMCGILVHVEDGKLVVPGKAGQRA